MTNKIVQEAHKRYKIANNYFKDSKRLSAADMLFAAGNSDNNYQWDNNVYTARNMDSKICLTINLTETHVRQIVNDIRMNKPTIRTIPVDSKADKQTAEIIDGVIRNIWINSQADDVIIKALECVVKGGEGYWRILTEYVSEDSLDQKISIKLCPNPSLVFIDPFATEIDRSDAQWGIIIEQIGKEDFAREYPKLAASASNWVFDSDGWSTDDGIRIAEYFWCEQTDDVLYEIETGEILHNSAMPQGCKITLPKGDQNGNIIMPSGDIVVITRSRKTKRKQWKWAKIVGQHDEAIEVQDWAGKYLPIVLVVGEEDMIDGKPVRKGIVRNLKDPARMANYSVSESVQVIALQTKTPFIVDPAAIEGYDGWDDANTSNRAYLKARTYDTTGRQLNPPQRQMPPQASPGLLQLLSMSIDQMSGTSGQREQMFAQNNHNISGLSVKRQQQQSEVSNYHYSDNLRRGLKYTGKVLLDLIPKVLPMGEIMRITGIDGKERSVMADARVPKSFTKQYQGSLLEVYNPSVGVYDVVIDTGPSYQTQRQETSAAMLELATKVPQLMQIAPDIFIRSFDFPRAEELATRLEATVDPIIRNAGKDDPSIIPQLQMKLKQAGEMIQQLSAENNEIKAEHSNKILDTNSKIEVAKISADAIIRTSNQKARIDAFEAETKRMIDLANIGLAVKTAAENIMPNKQAELTDISAFLAQQNAPVQSPGNVPALMETPGLAIGNEVEGT